MLSYNNIASGDDIFSPMDGTDLACEVWDGGEDVLCCDEILVLPDGTVHIDRMEIVTEGAAQRLGRRRGKYITATFPQTLSKLCAASRSIVASMLADELLSFSDRLCGQKAKGDLAVLVAGLGNSDLTADGIGPATASLVAATSHLRDLDIGSYKALGCSAVSVVIPGVLGRTGIESADILRGAIKASRPDLLIAVDSLAARSCRRLGSTLQLTDSGITPGSGVDNGRTALTHKTLGVPIISVGVPTVVGSATLIFEALHEAGVIADDRSDVSPKLSAVLGERQNFFVSPRDADLVTTAAADIISCAVNSAFGIIE